MKSEIVTGRESESLEGSRWMHHRERREHYTNPHRSLTHVAIARTNDTEHNRRPVLCVFLLSHSSCCSLVCSIPAKSYLANRIWQIMHSFVPDYKFLMPTLPPFLPFKQTKFPVGDVNDWIDSEGRSFFHLSRERGCPTMIYQDDPPFCSEGFLIGGGPLRKGIEKDEMNLLGHKSRPMISLMKRWKFTICLCLWSLLFRNL